MVLLVVTDSVFSSKYFISTVRFRCLEKGHIKMECRNALRCMFCDSLGHSKLTCGLRKQFDKIYEKKAYGDVSGYSSIILMFVL